MCGFGDRYVFATAVSISLWAHFYYVLSIPPSFVLKLSHNDTFPSIGFSKNSDESLGRSPQTRDATASATATETNTEQIRVLHLV